MRRGRAKGDVREGESAGGGGAEGEEDCWRDGKSRRWEVEREVVGCWSFAEGVGRVERGWRGGFVGGLGREEEGVGGGESRVKGGREDRVLLIRGILQVERRGSDPHRDPMSLLAPLEPRWVPRKEPLVLARAVPT